MTSTLRSLNLHSMDLSSRRSSETDPAHSLNGDGLDALTNLRGRDILCFSHDWTGDPLSKTHLMRLAAKHNRVLWINSIGYRAPKLNKSDMGRVMAKLKAAATKDRLSEVEKNIFVLHPLAVPKYGSPLFRTFNRQILSWQVRRAMRRLRFKDPINWVFNPVAGLVAGHLGETKIIYHCVDEYTQFTGVDAEALGRIEAELLRRSDLVVVSAQRLYDSKAAQNSNTHLVRHGVDVAHFGSALSEHLPIHPDLKDLPRPIIGFFGLIADWVDLDLLAELADRFSHGSIVLVGKSTTDDSQLRAKPNVHFLGRRPYEDLPSYCKAFDVAVIPFRINELTLNANPLKALEYLAAGLPVVSSPIPEVESLGLVRIADDANSFEHAICDALCDPGPNPARSRSVQSETWANRLVAIDRLLAAS